MFHQVNTPSCLTHKLNCMCLMFPPNAYQSIVHGFQWHYATVCCLLLLLRGVNVQSSVCVSQDAIQTLLVHQGEVWRCLSNATTPDTKFWIFANLPVSHLDLGPRLFKRCVACLCNECYCSVWQLSIFWTRTVCIRIMKLKSEFEAHDSHFCFIRCCIGTAGLRARTFTCNCSTYQDFIGAMLTHEWKVG